jgi:ParB/RepB/Spo0J family partition protein
MNSINHKHGGFMSKSERFLRDLQAEAAAAQVPPPAPAPTEPNKYAALRFDRATGTAYAKIAEIIPDPDQPRKDFDPKELADLTATVRTHGVLESVLLRWGEQGKLIIVAGERRVRAAGAAGLTEVPCRLADELTEDQIDEIQLIENIQRVGLKPSEQAAWIRKYMTRHPGMTQKQVAERVRLSEATISEVLAASELPAPILALVDAGVIPIRVGADLTKIEDEVEQATVAERIVNQRMNRSDALAEVAAQKPGKRKRRRRAATKKENSPGEFCHKLPVQDEFGHVHSIAVTSPHPITKPEAARLLRLAGDLLDEQKREAA